GRGFAVVATEVRSLAGRSATAAKDIKALIAESGAKVEAGAKQVNIAGAAMQALEQSIARVTNIMSDISNASREQHDGVQQINRAVGQMDEMTQQNAALVEQAAAAALALEDQARQLQNMVTGFRLH
ncbi:MAG: methyl-accepting chemotaxis protein, partial [Rhodocyclaceae bacterium]|nr:methyl-accepting chemotaxis protein [Rhodocyclaceae bacterium]